MNCLKSCLFVIGCILVGACSHAWAAALPFGQPQTGTISSVAQSNSYTFSTNASGVIDFTVVVTSGKLVPRIQVYNPDGSLNSGTNSGAPFGCSGSALELNTVALKSAGTYTVLISDCSDTNTGNYTIYAQLTNNPAGAAALLFGGQPQTGTISSVTQSNSYIFSANAKDVMDFTLVATSANLVPKIRLYNPDGSLNNGTNSGAPFGCSGPTLEMNTITLPTAGAYTVLVGDCGDTNAGNYSIYAQRTNNPAGAAVLLFGGQPQTGTISSVTQSNSYTFGATAKDVVNLTMVATSGSLVPKIRLYNPDGTLNSGTNSGAPFGCSGSTLEMNSIKLPASGNYTLLVGDCADTNPGSYNLSGQCFGVCTAPPPPPANCTFALAPVNQVLPAAAGTGAVGVLTTAGCPWTASTAASFLKITSGSSGTGPGGVQFSVTANATAAARAGTLTIAGQTATVNQTGTAPLLLLSPSSITVQWRQQSPPPAAISLSVFTAASSLNYTATASSTGNWLSLSPASGSAPATIIVSVNPSSLQPGTYQGTVTVTAPTANPPSQTFTVSLTVVAAGLPALSVSTTSLSYSFAQGSQQVRQQRILIGNSGGGTLSFIASASTNSGGKWLSVTQDGAGATLSTPDPLTVSVDPSGLGVGTFTGLIAITADTTQNIPVTVTVNAVVQMILLSQTGLTFTAVANGGIVPPQTFGILNSGNGSMDWSVSSLDRHGWKQLAVGHAELGNHGRKLTDRSAGNRVRESSQSGSGPVQRADPGGGGGGE